MRPCGSPTITASEDHRSLTASKQNLSQHRREWRFTATACGEVPNANNRKRGTVVLAARKPVFGNGPIQSRYRPKRCCRQASRAIPPARLTRHAASSFRVMLEVRLQAAEATAIATRAIAAARP